jgi:hypothetical protein
MAQVCSVMQYLHKLNIGYFIHFDNLFVTRGLEIRVRGFKRAYKVAAWVDNRKEGEERQPQALLLPCDLNDYPYRFACDGDMDNEKCDVLSLGLCLYRILFEKLPFEERMGWGREDWSEMWVVES